MLITSNAPSLCVFVTSHETLCSDNDVYKLRLLSCKLTRSRNHAHLLNKEHGRSRRREGERCPPPIAPARCPPPRPFQDRPAASPASDIIMHLAPLHSADALPCSPALRDARAVPLMSPGGPIRSRLLMVAHQRAVLLARVLPSQEGVSAECELLSLLGTIYKISEPSSRTP